MRNLKMIIIIVILIPSYSFSVMFGEIETTENTLRILSNSARIIKNEYIYNTSQYPNYLITQPYINNFNKYKGNISENIMDQFFLKDGWHRVIPSLNNNGIDGLYLKYKNDSPVDMIVSESKYGTSKLGNTSHGKQMSPTWIKNNISNLKKDFLEIKFDPNIDIKKASDSFDLPISGNKSVKVYRINNRLYIKDTKNIELVKKSINNHVKYLEGIENGNLNYRRRLFNFNFENNNNVSIKIIDMDSQKVTLLKTENFKNLPPSHRNAIKNGIIKNDMTELIKQGYNKKAAYNKATKQFETRLKNNELHKYSTSQIYKLNPLLTDALKIGFTSIGISLLEEFILSNITGQKINWNRTFLRSALIGSVETPIVLYSRFVKNPSPLVSNLYMLAGITAVDLLLSWISGDLTKETILNTTISFGGTLAATLMVEPVVKSVLMFIATNFGEASTGVAISSLSGAAAKKAALAWLGGGALSAGGGGIAAGTALIAGISVGVVVVTIIVYQGYKAFKNHQLDNLIREDTIQYLKVKYE